MAKAAEICQNPTEPCVRSSALAVGMAQEPVPWWGWLGDQRDPAGMSPVGTNNLGGGTRHGGQSSQGTVNTAEQDNIHKGKPGG